MKKSIFLLAVFSIILAGCYITPPPPPAPTPVIRTALEITVELRPGGPLQLGPGEHTGFINAITGFRGEAIEPVDVLILFKNETLSGDIDAGTAVSWIPNMPQGMTARVREAKKGGNRIILLVEGKPSIILNEAMRFNIPGSVFTSRGQNVIFTSDQAKFEILQGSLNLSARSETTPAASNFEYINGSVGTKLDTVDLRVGLLGSSLKEAILKETPVDWVVNCPNGLSVTVQPVAAGAATLFLTVRGTPQEARNELVNVTIPSHLLGDVENFHVPNETIRWQILGGTITSVLISGSVDSAIIARDVNVTLMGDVFSLDMAPGTAVNWITNLPSGLTARVKRVRANERTGIITVAGSPAEPSVDVLAIAVPASAVKSRTVVPVIGNVDARFAINANTRQISVTEDYGGSSNPNWMGAQKGPLNIPILPTMKDFQGLGLVTVKANAVEKLGADNQYHWIGNTVNYGMLIEAAARLGAHAIINVVVDYTDSVEYREVVRELAMGHEWSEDELDKISRGILREMRKDGIHYSIETSHIVTRTYIASALAIKYIDGLNFYEAERLRSTTTPATK